MGKPQRRKKHHSGDTHLRRRWRTKNRKRDLDEIDNDLKTNPEKLIDQEIDFEQKGLGQHYCIHCAKYFIDDHALQSHFKTKVHKRRMKALEIEPYSVEESERAAGHGNYKAPLKRTIETQPSKDEVRGGKRIKIDVKNEEEKMTS
ncbi:zinc finger protein 593 homolog [Condylostylus longicornis]|uniref:zinc finger protein 593 homolog n=1 Tax=Condylostylus longicornis TaxID=2530218 RepID=UPI00244DCCD6|nr:zinc finger protein 593 homolog [Condylostylus longicornis]